MSTPCRHTSELRRFERINDAADAERETKLALFSLDPYANCEWHIDELRHDIFWEAMDVLLETVAADAFPDMIPQYKAKPESHEKVRQWLNDVVARVGE